MYYFSVVIMYICVRKYDNLCVSCIWNIIVCTMYEHKRVLFEIIIWFCWLCILLCVFMWCIMCSCKFMYDVYMILCIIVCVYRLACLCFALRCELLFVVVVVVVDVHFHHLLDLGFDVCVVYVCVDLCIECRSML